MAKRTPQPKTTPKRRQSKELITSVDSALLDKAEALVRERRTVPRAKLPEWKQLAPAAQTQLVDALVGRGLEVGEKGALRVPAREQAASLAQGGARLSWKAAQQRVVGVSAAERSSALSDALTDGSLYLVVRTKVDTVVDGREDVLTQDEVKRLAKAHEALGAVLKLVQKKLSSKGPLAGVQKTLLREDAAGVLEPFSAWIGDSSNRKHLSEEASCEMVVNEIRNLEEPPIPLVWVPDLVRNLAHRMSKQQVHGSLLAAQRRGIVELRPESGVNRLSPADAALCPPDPDGIPLSHARRLSAQ
ncbi:hypothetical protein WME88_51795 [Sorangium sp. So ce216]